MHTRVRRRLEALESRTSARASPSSASWRTPEEAAERERRYEELFRELGVQEDAPPKSGKEARERLFDLVEEHQEQVRKETRA